MFELNVSMKENDFNTLVDYLSSIIEKVGNNIYKTKEEYFFDFNSSLFFNNEKRIDKYPLTNYFTDCIIDKNENSIEFKQIQKDRLIRSVHIKDIEFNEESREMRVRFYEFGYFNVLKVKKINDVNL